jgi:hypothetical protein
MFFCTRLDFQNGHITEPWDKYSSNQRPRGIIHRNEVHHRYEDEDTKIYHHQDDFDETVSEENETENEQEDDLWPLKESQLLLTVPYVRGFDLQRKIWGRCIFKPYIRGSRLISDARFLQYRSFGRRCLE